MTFVKGANMHVLELSTMQIIIIAINKAENVLL